MSLLSLVFFNICFETELFRRLSVTWDKYSISFVPIKNLVLNLMGLTFWLRSHFMSAWRWVIKLLRETNEGLIGLSRFNRFISDMHQRWCLNWFFINVLFWNLFRNSATCLYLFRHFFLLHNEIIHLKCLINVFNFGIGDFFYFVD